MAEEEIKKTIEIPAKITVREFALKLNKPVTELIAILMENGILASQNELIDYETAAIISEDLGIKTKLKKEEQEFEAITPDEILKKEDKAKLKPRPPVVVVLGHVDHGKTQLLDTIRKTNVVAKEAGGITQHISAYQVEKNKKIITFIDTPGHEAFTAMRSRGTKIADIAVLVIAADDGVKPQTKEAIKIIKAGGIPFIVAINKIDKPEADIEKVKKQLADLGYLPEDWSGKTICTPVSAKTGQGINELLEMILLVADMEKDEIKANPEGELLGTIIESRVDPQEGAVSVVLIQNGSLKIGDTVEVGRVYGKIKTMKDFKGELLRQAMPAQPVKILGLKDSPVVGEILRIAKNLSKLKKNIKKHRLDYHLKTPTQIKFKTKKQDEEEKEEEKKSAKTKKVKPLNIVLKADTLGSLEAISEALNQIKHEDFKIEIVHRGLGNITEADVGRAEAAHGLLYGFNVKPTSSAENVAKGEEFQIKTFNIIYNLVDEVTKEAELLLNPEILVETLGRVKILAVFRNEKTYQIIGGKVTKGKIVSGAKAKVFREKQKVASGRITQLQINKKNVKEVAEGLECGMKFEGEPVVQVNDFVEVYQEKKIFKKLS
jgi:translation initiation factor IF-2